MSNGVEVLIVDDDENIRWAIQEVLSLGNIECKSASSGDEALSLIEKTNPSLAVLDLRLGPINGVQVAERMFKIKKDIKFLFVTGQAEMLKKKSLDYLPVVGILNKPFNIVELLEKVKESLDSD